MRKVLFFLFLLNLLSLESYAQNQPVTDQSQDAANSKVIKHLRFNKGSPFPDKDAWKKKVVEKVKASLESGKSAWPGYAEPGSMIVPRIPPCVENKTIVAHLSDGSVPKTDVLFDHLFFRDTSPMLDVAKVFGPQIKVSPVTDDSDTPQALAASGLGVTCLPTRYRSVGGNWYKLEGEDALKNYSEDLKGKMHGDVAQRLSSFF